MKMPQPVFETLTTDSPYKVQGLLSARQFADFCTKRDHPVSVERLRKLEQLGLFLPLLRVRKPDVVIKVETLTETTYRYLGELEDGEDWSGETRLELAPFDFHPQFVDNWRAHGLAWSPYDGPSIHNAEIDTDPNRHEAYYSTFQIWDLVWTLSGLNVRVTAESAFNPDGTLSTHLEGLAERLAALAKDAIASKDQPRFRKPYGFFAQLISDRFYPQTQTDGRLIMISSNSLFHGWEWEAHARDWSPQAVQVLFGLERDESANIASQLAAEVRMADPMDAWRDLTRFIAIDERKRLKGKALYAETLSEMAHMHRLFHRLAFGEDLKDPHDSGYQRLPEGVTFEDDPYRLLELTTNTFHLNPKPKLVLIVEGETEEAVIPDLFKRCWGAPMARFGIQLRNMHGVGNATGSKSDVRSALWRLVDFLHAQQTLALVLFDRESLAGRNIAKGLREAMSIHSPDRRVTRSEYIKLWNRCFELDNFSNSEIAAAMSKLSGMAFHGREIRPCRLAPPPKTKAATLASVYESRTNTPLDKIALARLLVEAMLAPDCPRERWDRPILRFLRFAAERAQRNHQPLTEAIWEENQRSGWVGTLTRLAASRRRRRKRVSTA